MSVNGGSQTAKAEFLPGQKDLMSQILTSVLVPQALGGAPDAGTAINNQRSRENFNQTIAQQGLTGSGLAVKGAAGLEQGLNQNALGARQNAVNQILTPVNVGSRSNGFGWGVNGMDVAAGLGTMFMK